MKRTLLFAALLLAACPASEPEPKPTPTPAATPKPTPKPAPTPEPAAEIDRSGYHEAMLDPAAAKEEAPAKYTVKFETTEGDILIDVTREWSPNGADRFYNLVKIGYFEDVAFFRAIDGFMIQFGIHGDPEVNKQWRRANIADDPRQDGISNEPGYLTFAKTGAPNSRSTQLFMNLGNNGRLDGMGFTPVGKLRSMDVLKKLHTGYGEGAPAGRGPHQGLVQGKGNAYLKAQFPELDYIKKATVESEGSFL